MLRLRADRSAVDPFAAALLVFFGEHADRPGFAAARPPVHDLGVLSRRLMRKQSGHYGQEQYAVTCHGPSPPNVNIPAYLRPSNESLRLSRRGGAARPLSALQTRELKRAGKRAPQDNAGLQ